MTENRPKSNSGRFTTSGNPRGRPKGYSAFRRSFRNKDDVEAIRARLRALITGDDNNASIAAAKLWLEYGFGKTPAAPDDNDAVRDSARPLAGMDGEQILAALRAKP